MRPTPKSRYPIAEVRQIGPGAADNIVRAPTLRMAVAGEAIRPHKEGCNLVIDSSADCYRRKKASFMSEMYGVTTSARTCPVSARQTQNPRSPTPPLEGFGPQLMSEESSGECLANNRGVRPEPSGRDSAFLGRDRQMRYCLRELSSNAE